MYDFSFCMKQECKVCSKQLECEKTASEGKINKSKNAKYKKRKKKVNIKGGVTHELQTIR